MNNEDYGDGMVNALTDSVLAVMERLDAMEQPPKVREPAYTGPPYTGLTAGDEIVNSAKLRDAKAMEQPPKVAKVENAITGEIVSMTPTTKAAIERAAMIKALRWAQKHVANPLDCHGYEMAITRLENGGEM